MQDWINTQNSALSSKFFKLSLSTTTGTVSLVQRDPWNDGGTKEFKLSIAMNEGGPFTEVAKAKTTEYMFNWHLE